jgi:hypothetical protein
MGTPSNFIGLREEMRADAPFAKPALALFGNSRQPIRLHNRSEFRP